MSLIEVMLATVMLLGCVMALSRVAFLARKHAISAEDRSLAQIHCQNIMEEILAGIRPMQNVAPAVFEGGDWVYLVRVEMVQQTGLASVTVIVDRLDNPEETLPNEDEIGGYRLVRWVRTGDRKLDLLPDDTGQDAGFGEDAGGLGDGFDQPIDSLDTASGDPAQGQ